MVFRFSLAKSRMTIASSTTSHGMDTINISQRTQKLGTGYYYVFTKVTKSCAILGFTKKSSQKSGGHILIRWRLESLLVVPFRDYGSHFWLYNGTF